MGWSLTVGSQNDHGFNPRIFYPEFSTLYAAIALSNNYQFVPSALCIPALLNKIDDF